MYSHQTVLLEFSLDFDLDTLTLIQLTCAYGIYIYIYITRINFGPANLCLWCPHINLHLGNLCYGCTRFNLDPANLCSWCTHLNLDQGNLFYGIHTLILFRPAYVCGFVATNVNTLISRRCLVQPTSLWCSRFDTDLANVVVSSRHTAHLCLWYIRFNLDPANLFIVYSL